MSNIIKPYGDTLNDGITQVSFTLPVEYSAKAKKAAEIYASKLGLEQVSVASATKIMDGFTYFVIYGKATPTLDYDEVQATEVAASNMNFYEINKVIKEKLGRHLVMVGASIGSDAHTVGIDAIMNMKGYNGNYGLERYSEVDAYNMGAQVPIEEMLKKAKAVNADVLLVSQTVTQKDAHIHNFTALVELLEAENLRKNFILIAGGPRVTNDLAIELGYDAGFGPGSYATDVAAFAIKEILKRKGIQL